MERFLQTTVQYSGIPRIRSMFERIFNNLNESWFHFFTTKQANRLFALNSFYDFVYWFWIICRNLQIIPSAQLNFFYHQTPQNHSRALRSMDLIFILFLAML